MNTKSAHFMIAASVMAVTCISTQAIASNWQYDASGPSARIKISDKDYFELSCYEPLTTKLIGKIKGNKYFQIRSFNPDESFKYGMGTESDRKGTHYFSSSKSRHNFGKETQINFRYQYDSKGRFKVTKKISTKGINNIIETLNNACSKVAKPIIWAHGDTCPAKSELLPRYDIKHLFKNGPVTSGKLKFFPTSGTASRNSKLTYIQNIETTGMNWCKESGNIAYYAPYAIERLGLYDKEDHFREFGCAIKQICPTMKTLAYTSTQEHGMKNFYANASSQSNFVPLTQKQFAKLDRGKILKCDMLASHPSDKLRPNGAKGVLEENMDAAAAATACADDIVQNPNLKRLSFQIGRAYLMLNKHKKAFAAFSLAAQKSYPAGVMYLGHAYANGWGTNVDLKLANINWRKATNLGASGGDDRKLEMTVAAAANTRARTICNWKDKACERRAKRPHYKSSLTAKQKMLTNSIFAKINPELRAVYSRMIAHDFEGLQLLKYEFLDRGTGKNTVIGLLAPLLEGSRNALELITEKSRFEPIIAQYALIKTNLLGSCGEPTIPFEVTHTRKTTWRNGYGFEVDSNTREIGRTYFKVPKRFASFITDTKTTGEWAEYSKGVKKFIFATRGCKSKVLKQLEKNMFDYLNWKPSHK